MAEATLSGLAVEDELLSCACLAAGVVLRLPRVRPVPGGRWLTQTRPGGRAPNPRASKDDNPSDLIYGGRVGGTSSNPAKPLRWTRRKRLYNWQYGVLQLPYNARRLRPEPRRRVLTSFLAKLNPAGGGLVYATSRAAVITNSGLGIAQDGAGRITVTGYADSATSTTPDAFDTGFHGNKDAFVVKLNPTGSTLDYGTFLGGADDEESLGVAVNESNNAYVAGWTPRSTRLPPRPTPSIRQAA